MLEEIEHTFKDLMAALQIAGLYPDWHPEFKKTVDKAFASLEEVLKERHDLIIGIIGEEIAFEKEILFDLSKIAGPSIHYLKDRGIERIQFLAGIDKEELSKFICLLAGPKEKTGHDVRESLSLLGIKNIIVGKIKASYPKPLSGKIEETISYLSIYEDSLDKVTHSLESVLNNEEIDRHALKMNLSRVMENLLGRYQDFLNLGTMKRYDTGTYFHTMNVAILSMYLSSKIGLAKEDILDIGIAALFHDIGKLHISRKLIQKSTALTEKELSEIKNHVILGSEILLKYVDALGILPVVACFEHHLKYDLSGYPKLAFRQSPHMASQIVSICDVYDALSQRRGYKNDYPPDMIYNLMMKEKGTNFEPQLLEKFFRIIGVWPVGTLLLLNDGRVAVVREENEGDIFLPKVEVISPADKREKIDLKTEADKFKIERFLNPLTEGKQYLHLI